MRYKPKGVAGLQIALGSLPGKMRVESDPGLGVSARTVGELRKAANWPDNLVISTPGPSDLAGAIRVSAASHATRTAPKN
jgi:hypothetical protein